VRILFVNKYLYAKGGSETHLLGLAAALEQHGHVVDYFGTEHSENATPSARTITISAVAYGATQSWTERLDALRNVLYSRPAFRRMRQYLSVARPSVGHLHNIYHQLSPSILVALREAGVPAVLTAHDYKLACPSYSLHDGNSQCFACRGHRYWNVLRRGCSRKGFAGDLALTIEAYVHHFLRLYEKYINRIIAPSRFVRDRLIEAGYSPARVCVLPNSLPVAQYQARPEPGDYMLFVGRLSYEKGIPTLIEAAQQLPMIPLWIVGEGPLRGELERQAWGHPQIRFLGQRSASEVKSMLRGCRALILSSHVPENCPLSVLEAFATAKPVIATNVGGIPELFERAPTGMVVPPCDHESLASAIQQFWSDPDLCWHCGTQARKQAELHHDLENYVARLEIIYRSVKQVNQAAPIDGASEKPVMSSVIRQRATTETYRKPDL
jgi:glycosyltransferase involved in cell wall biosynthesis